MNAKKLKQLRQSIRRQCGILPRVGYIEGPRGRVSVEIPHLQLNGTTLITREIREITGTIRLNPRSQRALYQHCKASAKRTGLWA